MRQAPYLQPKVDELCELGGAGFSCLAHAKRFAVQDAGGGDWQSCRLLSLEGVIGYNHRGSTYYCPVQVYVQLSHPERRPTAYVRPTAGECNAVEWGGVSTTRVGPQI
jgi:hypothetical protein